MTTGTSIKANEKLADLFEDATLKMNFNRKKLSQFLLFVRRTYPTLPKF
jgi:hypothetical protein